MTKVNGVRKATPLLVVLVMIELSDVIFAVDSIPAVVGITSDAMVVYSSNVFALMALRSLYLLLSKSVESLYYLRRAAHHTTYLPETRGGSRRRAPTPPPPHPAAPWPQARRRAHPLLCRREDGGRVLPLPRQRLHLARRHRRLAHRRRRRLAAPEPTHDRRGCEQRGAGREAARRRCGLKPQPGRLRARSSLLRAGSI